MSRPGIIALPVLLTLGAVTGFLAYDLMVVKAGPVEGRFDGLYDPTYSGDVLHAQAASGQNVAPAEDVSTDQQPDAVTPEPSSIVTISILEGSVVQGAPDYEPDPATIPLDAAIRWVNDDNVLHTATYGTGIRDDNYGSLFDTGFLNPGQEYSIAASEIGAGEYSYFCIAHPYMVGTIIIE